MKKLIKILALAMAVLMLFAACSGNGENETTTELVKTAATKGETTTFISNFPTTTAPDYDLSHHLVKFTMENGDTFVIETYPEYAPATCDNFISLVSEGFYDGLTFHRVIDNFMAQGGDPEGNGTGGSDEKIKGEFASNGFTQNTLKHERGVVSMARSMHPDSASSQFFICYETKEYLDGDYAAFGKVVEGMETVDSFLEVDRPDGSTPSTPIVIEKAEVIE